MCPERQPDRCTKDWGCWDKRAGVTLQEEDWEYQFPFLFSDQQQHVRWAEEMVGWIYPSSPPAKGMGAQIRRKPVHSGVSLHMQPDLGCCEDPCKTFSEFRRRPKFLLVSQNIRHYERIQARLSWDIAATCGGREMLFTTRKSSVSCGWIVSLT